MFFSLQLYKSFRICDKRYGLFTKSYDEGTLNSPHTNIPLSSYWRSLITGGSWRAILTRCAGSSWSTLQRAQSSCNNTAALISRLKTQSQCFFMGWWWDVRVKTVRSKRRRPCESGDCSAARA